MSTLSNTINILKFHRILVEIPRCAWRRVQDTDFGFERRNLAGLLGEVLLQLIQAFRHVIDARHLARVSQRAVVKDTTE